MRIVQKMLKWLVVMEKMMSIFILFSKNCQLIITESNEVKDDVITPISSLPSDVEKTIKKACCVYSKKYGTELTSCIVCGNNKDPERIENCHSHLMYHAIVKFQHNNKNLNHSDHHNVVIGKTVPILMVIVLSIHSIMEGLSLGSVANDSSSSLSTFIAIVVHKGFAAYAMGSLCREADVSVKGALPGFLTFSLMSPIGGIIGAIVSETITEGKFQTWFTVIFQGIACGTFLYVGLLEVISHELHSEQGNPFYKLLLIILGAILMAILGYWV